MLQLGIRNIFDAYLANLCEMSSEPNLYVRSVEQVITISVQKYYTFHKCEYSIKFRTFGWVEQWYLKKLRDTLVKKCL